MFQRYYFRSLVTCFFLALPLAFGQVQLSAQEGTQWTSTSGKTIEAEFVRLSDDGVILKLKSNGQQATVPFSSLSLESHLQAIKLGKPEAFSKPVPKAEIAPVIEVPPLISYDLDSVLRSPFSESQSLQVFVDTLSSELEQGNNFAVWHALPEKMQTDLEDLIVAAMAKVGKQPVVQVRTLLNDLNTIIVDKKDFIFGNATLTGDKQTRKELYSHWPMLEQFVGSISKDELWQSENFEKGNVENWLANFLCTLGSNQPSMDMLSEEAGIPRMKLSDVVTVASAQADKGKIRIGMPGLPPAAAQEYVVRKFNDIWLVPAWMNQLKEGVEKAQTELEKADADQVRSVIQTGLFAVVPTFSALARAETQEEFDAIIEGLKPLIDSVKENIPAEGFNPAMVAGLDPAAGGGAAGQPGGRRPPGRGPGSQNPGPGSAPGGSRPGLSGIGL